MRKILSIIALSGVLYAIYQSYNKARTTKKEVKIID
jgi:hypothetical protein